MKKTPSDRRVDEIEKFEKVFSEIPEAIALLRGPTHIFEMANPAYFRLIGRNDIVGKPLLDALPELANQAFPELMTRVFETGVSFEARELEALLRLDSAHPEALSRVYVDVSYRRVLTDASEPYGIFVFAVNVTEKVASRLAIQTEQQKLEAVFANASASLAILRGDELVFEKANASYIGLFYDRPLLGKSLLEALPELRDQKFPQLLRDVYNTGITYTEVEAVAYLRRTADSPLEKRYFDQSYNQIQGHDGKVYGVLIQAIDVTERVVARKNLAESAERLQHVLHAANMGTWDTDMQTGIVECSERTSELFGLPHRKEGLFEDTLKRVHPEDLPRVRRAIAEATDPNGDGRYHIEYRIVCESETVRWISLRGQSVFDDTPQGKVTCRFSGTVLDVTERVLSELSVRKSEEQFRHIADLMPQVVWTARPDGVLDYTNQRWTQYSGSSDPEAWLTFVHPDDIAVAVETWTTSVSSGKPYQTEFRLKRGSDDSYRWFLVRAQASFSHLGEVERWFGTCTDIEEQKAALAERSNFISIASHELKTPLTSLKLQTQSMRRNYDKQRADAFSIEKVQILISNNEKQVDRLVRLVDDMLDFSKIESGKLSMMKERTDLCEVAREVYERLKEQLEAAGCKSEYSCPKPIFVEIDRFRIEQVITNLLTNAIRYGRGKPVSIQVSQKRESASISVTDRGMGISEENIARIFNRFERAVSANEVSGLGLGLFISKEIVDAHDGKVHVTSSIGQGSTFEIEFPLGTTP